ncbi:hypothetical protein [Paenibacillus sp. R14(2021)]
MHESFEFAGLKEAGLALRFSHVEAGPLVRSSYEQAEHAKAAAGTGRLV